jgi:hypothetical protein
MSSGHFRTNIADGSRIALWEVAYCLDSLVDTLPNWSILFGTLSYLPFLLIILVDRSV